MIVDSRSKKQQITEFICEELGFSDLRHVFWSGVEPHDFEKLLKIEKTVRCWYGPKIEYKFQTLGINLFGKECHIALIDKYNAELFEDCLIEAANKLESSGLFSVVVIGSR